MKYKKKTESPDSDDLVMLSATARLLDNESEEM